MEFINKRLRFIKPRFLTFKDWYKTVFPLNRIRSLGNMVTLRNGTTFFVRGVLGSDINTIIDLFYYNVYFFDILTLSSKPVVLDIGANIGCFTKLIHNKFPDAEIFSYEANVENFDMLRKNVGDIAEIHNLIVTGKEVINTLYLSGSHSSSTLFKRNINQSTEGIKTQNVSNIHLSDILNKHKTVDLMKMDIEEAEYETILNTDMALLKKIKYILIEIHNSNPTYTVQNLVDYINKSGFTSVKSYGEVYYFANTDKNLLKQ